MHYKDILVEGFEVHILLSQCLKNNITLQNVKILSDYEFTARIFDVDWDDFSRIVKNNYSVTIIKEKGVKKSILRLTANPFTVIGLVLFALIIFLQTTFISEVRIYGYEKFTEREILGALKEVGLYPGCSRYIDQERIKIEMFRKLDNLSWIGIELRGGLAVVTIAEGVEQPKEIDENATCHIIAKKEGYIEKVIAKEGAAAVEKDDFVNVGEVLISGIIEIEDKTYSSDPETHYYRYVHSDGDVYAKTIYRFICYQEAYEIIRKPFGKPLPGIRLKLGGKTFNTADIFTPFSVSTYSERNVLNLIWPIPLELSLNKVYQLELSKRERTQEEIENRGNVQIREFVKNNISESAQILNKDLKFLSEENIIKVTILIEALEQIGEKKPFIPRIEQPEV